MPSRTHPSRNPKRTTRAKKGAPEDGPAKPAARKRSSTAELRPVRRRVPAPRRGRPQNRKRDRRAAADVSIFLTFYAAALALVYLEFRELGHAGRAAYAAVACVDVVRDPRRHVRDAVAWSGTRLPRSPAANRGARSCRSAWPVTTQNIPMPLPLLCSRWAGAAIVLAAGFVLQRGETPRAVRRCGCAAAALSLAAPAFISPDPYADVGDALLGAASYAPPHSDFPASSRWSITFSRRRCAGALRSALDRRRAPRSESVSVAAGKCLRFARWAPRRSSRSSQACARCACRAGSWP